MIFFYFNSGQGGQCLFTTAVLHLIISLIGIWGLIRFVRWGHQGGQAYGARAGAGWAGGLGGGQARQPQQRRVTVEEVAEALSRLPTETYMTPGQLAALPVHELKALLHGRGLEPVRCLEKGELVRQLLEHGGSSAHSCSICCEDYAAGSAEEVEQSGAKAAVETGLEEAGRHEHAGAARSPEATGRSAAPAPEAEAEPVVLRVLQCGHRFHVECVDKWFLSATDYTRTPACPLCNAPLLREQPQPQAQDRPHAPQHAGRQQAAR
ncbi:hypothetical protein GPECTOR_96g707 [Gonium pectorale]|uniref:RING-type domain-containing protein n=1 Tax=Gonium pectorale TaxID=33097 RepID=A0A150G091_GONPE|nr:hypothetical protein GPECTOR_96g707 [Gonium pectorale]|eukprot:KXZ43241.1 hypothetical protein GPECTOR_96g707 [Gonium pectorale]